MDQATKGQKTVLGLGRIDTHDAGYFKFLVLNCSFFSSAPSDFRYDGAAVTTKQTTLRITTVPL
jgi:hypothetical protein